jgi:esterase/lipase
MHPNKRELQPYHKEWLENPLKHSMNIAKHKDSDDTPYLIVTLNPTAPKSKRVQTIEKQLKQRGINTDNIKNNSKTLVLLHGKNGRKEDLLPVAERYIALGFTCILPDLPTHGESNIETLYYATTAKEQHYVEKVLDDAFKHIELNKNLYIWGMSLGGAFAIQNIYHSKYNFKAIILVATYDKLDGVLKEKSSSIFGETLGGIFYTLIEKTLNIVYNFNPKDSNSAYIASKLILPIYMVHGKKDELISWERGKNLFENFGSKDKKFSLDEEGDHHNILVTESEFYADSGVYLLGN